MQFTFLHFYINYSFTPYTVCLLMTCHDTCKQTLGQLSKYCISIHVHVSCCCLYAVIVILLFLLFCFRAILIFSPFHSVASIFLYIHFFCLFVNPFLYCTLLPSPSSLGVLHCTHLAAASRLLCLPLFVSKLPLFTFQVPQPY